MANFFCHVFAEAKAISGILSHDVPMVPLTASKTTDCAHTSTCANCGGGFSQTNPKTCHHNHVTGRYLYLASCNCNQALKPCKCRVSSAFLVPIVCHNLSSYDGHFVLQFFRKEYSEYMTKTGKMVYAYVGVIPLNGEQNMMLRISNIVFVDSCKFHVTSLDNLVKEMRKHVMGAVLGLSCRCDWLWQR